MRQIFHIIAKWVSEMVGSPAAFILAVILIAIWILTGPHFGYSDTWQLIINTGTTILTFLIVFLIQNTQNRDAKTMQLKLDELIKATRAASDDLIDLEEKSDEELEVIEQHYRTLSDKIAKHRSSRSSK